MCEVKVKGWLWRTLIIDRVRTFSTWDNRRITSRVKSGVEEVAEAIKTFRGRV